MSDEKNAEWENYQKRLDDHNWKMYEASNERISMLNQRQADQDGKLDQWIMTMAAGSFGMSFAFIDKIVPVQAASFVPLLIGAWSGFFAVLVIGVIGFLLSGLLHTVLAEEEARMLQLKYEGEAPEYKKRGIFFDPNAVLGYAQILLFIGSSVCLILFIAKNLL